MSNHMLATLRNLVVGNTAGFHFGTLKALVKRGLAETYQGKYGTEYRATEKGCARVTREQSGMLSARLDTDGI